MPLQNEVSTIQIKKIKNTESIGAREFIIKSTFIQKKKSFGFKTVVENQMILTEVTKRS